MVEWQINDNRDVDRIIVAAVAVETAVVEVLSRADDVGFGIHDRNTAHICRTKPDAGLVEDIEVGTGIVDIPQLVKEGDLLFG